MEFKSFRAPIEKSFAARKDNRREDMAPRAGLEPAT
jgi:hypothetical protein